ncbi:MAG TPA: ROK family protein [Tepidisphaeraceae bacterium]|nr:ROK family protein [Tepidisphaeraceae bacterium]
MATSTHLRRINQRRMISALLGLRMASRADLAKATGLSQPTACNIADELLAARLLEEVDSTDPDNSPPGERRMGRPGQLLRLDRTTPRFLAIQLGVEHTRLSRVPVAAQEEDAWAVEIPTARTAEQWAADVNKASRRLRSQPLDAVLLSVPGVVDERAGRVLLCPNLHWAEAVNLHDLAGQLWKAPVCVVQEIRALALGHQAIASPDHDFLLVDFGEGVGAAAVVGGRLYQSPVPLSGELGHTPVLGNRRQCGCGSVGCIETLVSRRGVLESFAAETRLPRSWGAMADFIGKHGIQPWLASTLDAAAATIAGAANVLGVQRVVITGSLNELPEAVIAYLSAAVLRGAMWSRFGQVLCQSAPRRRTAGLVSAAINRVLLPDIQERSPSVRDGQAAVA